MKKLVTEYKMRDLHSVKQQGRWTIIGRRSKTTNIHYDDICNYTTQKTPIFKN